MQTEENTPQETTVDPVRVALCVAASAAAFIGGRKLVRKFRNRNVEETSEGNLTAVPNAA